MKFSDFCLRISPALSLLADQPLPENLHESHYKVLNILDQRKSYNPLVSYIVPTTGEKLEVVRTIVEMFYRII